MSTKLRLPTPGKEYDQRNEAETRREIELLVLKSVPGLVSSGAARRTVVFATANLANGATESGFTDFGAPGQHLIMIHADRSSRVRLYADQNARDDDLARLTTTAPESGVGVFLDAVWSATHTKYIAPPVFLYNADSPVASRIYYNITNTSGSTVSVVVTATVISAEVGALGLNPVDDSTVDGEVFNLTGAANGNFLKRSGGVWIPSNIAASDIASGTIATARLGSGTADATKYLRGDQTWSDLNASHLTTGTVGTARLGSGTANNTKYLRGDQTWSDLDAGHITAGTVATARLGSGTADNTKFLRGDQTWAVPSGGGSGDGTIKQFGGDAQPASPNSMDDEFEGTSLDAKWNNRNSAVLAFYGGQSRISIKSAQGAADNWRYIAQTAPSAPWKFRAKIAGVGALVNFRSFCLIVAKATTTDKLMVIGPNYNNAPRVDVNKFTNWTTFSAAAGTSLALAEVGPMGEGHILEIENDGTNLFFRWASSENAVEFRTLHSETIATFMGSIAEIGIGVDNNNNTNGDVFAVVDWFRRIS